MPRETILLVCIPVLAALFAVTAYAAKLWHSKQRALAKELYQRGGADLKAGQARKAIDDFRGALTYSRNDQLYQLRLAQALLAANQVEEARPYLLNLWQREPGNGTVNLELARLAARQGNVTEGVRYFHNAIYGVWEEDPENQRRQVRLELCEFLLSYGRNNEAQAALIELVSDLPKDAELHARVGTLFLKAEDYKRALETFREALRLDPTQDTALVGAGEAAFQMANYRGARRYLERAVREDSQDTHAAELLATTKLILAIDPFERGLSASERARRVVRAFGQAVERLRDCALKRGEVLEGEQPLTELQTVYARAMKLRPRVRERTLRRDSDLLVSAMDLVFEIEEFAARDCGSPTSTDLALLLIARKQGSLE